LSNLLNEKEQEILELEQENENCERKISELNEELKSCLEAWDKEKAASLPSRKQMNDLQSEMGKFQDYASELDTKTKQLL
jgi:protein-arginine kinase activator protein McsA